MFTFNLFQSRTECLVGKNVLIRKVLSLMYVAEFRLDNSDSFISIIIHPWLVITIRNGIVVSIKLYMGQNRKIQTVV
jgi:hypothetical protein